MRHSGDVKKSIDINYVISPHPTARKDCQDNVNAGLKIMETQGATGLIVDIVYLVNYNIVNRINYIAR